MLPAAHRLRRRSDFQRVYKTGKTLRAGLFRIRTAPNNGVNSRFGVVISNKTLKGATKRNKKKRQIREALHALLPQIRGGYDIVVIASPEVETASYADIEQQLSAGFEKIGFITGAAQE